MSTTKTPWWVGLPPQVIGYRTRDGSPIYAQGGGAEGRGYNASGDVLTQTVDGRPLNDMWREFQTAMADQNDARGRLFSLMSYKTTTWADDIAQGTVLGDFEPSSEYGEPVGLRTKPATLTMAYPFRWYDIGLRYTWMYLIDVTAEQLQASVNGVIEADNRLTFTRHMQALLVNTNRTNDHGQTVLPLYNNDGTTPPDYLGKTFLSTHSHYFGTTTAVLGADDVEGLIRLVTEHGYGTDSRPGEKVVLIGNATETDVIRGFKAGAGSPAALYDFIAADGAPAFLTPDNIIGDRAPAQFNGLPLIGSYGNAYVIENSFMPTGYLVALATSGPNNARNVLAMREHSTADARGLRLVKGRTPDFPLVDAFYNRGFGVGVRQRGAAAALQVVASATYTPPAAYMGLS